MADFKYCLLALAPLFSYQSVYAENWQNHFSSEFEYLSTSGDFERRALTSEYRYQNLDDDNSDNSAYIGTQSRYEEINDEGRTFRGRSVSFIGGAQLLTNTHLSGHLGLNRLEDFSNQQERNLVSYSLKSKTALSDKVTMTVQHEHNLPYQKKIIETESGQLLDMKTSALDVNVQITDQVSIEGKTEYRKLSDGNAGRKNRAGIHYTVIDHSPWMSVGFETGRIDYSETDEGYWTPQDRKNYDVVFNSSIPVSEALDISVFAALGRSKDGSEDSYVTGSYLSTSANYQSTENLQLQAKLQYGKSYGDESFSETGAGLGLTFEHF